ncbi:MAG: phage portal protein, partial [Clostridia bacterium]|nr:phage portal protein [Clostridia bacterium]
MVKNQIKEVISIFSLKNYLSSQGVIKSDLMTASIELWERLYKGESRLQLAASVASETARLATLEMKSEISGSKRADFLNRFYKDALKGMRVTAELAAALGGVVLKPYVADGKILISRISPQNFVPIEFDETGTITDAVFLDRFSSGKSVFTRIERHSFENGQYVIRNSAFVSGSENDLGKSINLSDTEFWHNIEPYVVCEGVQKPLFAYIKMPMANSIDVTSPLGVSVYSKVVPLIADAEKQYERLMWEFESGERALYVDESAIRSDKNGEKNLPDKRLYRMLNSGNDALFEDWTPTLRSKEIKEGLNEILRRIEFGTGLAYGTLSDIQNIDRTAEEFRASKQRSYTHICDIQAELRKGLSDLVYAMDTLADLYSLTPCGKFYISFDFDDSIVADRKTEFDEKMRLLEKGIISPAEMRAWYLGEEDKEAEKNLNQML